MRKSKDSRIICQNCKNYKRPCCYVDKDPKYTARKNSCEWFKRKK